MEVIYSINGKYFKAFGVYISESKGLLDKLKPKPRKAYDWAEYHGKVVDLSAPKYEEREITLTGWIEGENWQTMKQNFDALLSEFDKGGLVRLLVEFGKELVYDVYLDGAVELEKSFKEGEIIGKFSLKLKEPNPVKKVLKLVGNDLELSFNSEDWVEVNIDGVSEVLKGSVDIRKTLPNREVDSRAVSGRNLMLNSKNIFNGYHFPIETTNSLEIGADYTFSVDVLGDVSGYIFLNSSLVLKYSKEGNINEWRRISVSFKFIKNDYYNREIYPHIYGATSLRNPKLEKGNKPTDWTPAPEETHYITIAGNIDKIKNLQTNAEEIW